MHLDLSLDLNFKAMDLKCSNSKSINIEVCLMDLKVISNSRDLNLGGFVKSKSKSFFKLSKQGIWILITEIQIHVPKSCDPNTAIESGFCLQEYPLFICNSISLTVQKKRGVIYARKKHCKNVIIFP